MITSAKWIEFTTLDVDDALVIDVQLAPRDALSRIERAINQPPRRVLGVVKVDPEYVGVTGPSEFEIWERRQHAIHVYGRIGRRRGGARVSATFIQSRRSWALVAVFFVLYGLFGAGFIARDPGPLGPLFSSLVLTVGGIALAFYFFLSARRQRADLRRFVTVIFADVAENGDDPSHPAAGKSASFGRPREESPRSSP
jgi:hypothetical protein